MPTRDQPARVLIMGAAGRDFHNFNVVYRDDPSVRVVAFTATQIPGISGRRYPPVLAGDRYPEGIPIVDAPSLEDLCRRESIDEVAFAYRDVSHAEVMHQASRGLAAGADFVLLNDFSFVAPDLSIAVTDALEPLIRSRTAARGDGHGGRIP